MPTFSELLDAARFTPEQRVNAQLILDKFAAAGLTSGIALAALVNAYAESLLDPLVCNDRTPWGADRGFGPIPGGEDSCGLFQLYNSPGASGDGMSVADRQNPHKNIARVISLLQGPKGINIRASQDKTLADLIYLFTTDIENPEYGPTRGNERIEKAMGWWGDLVIGPTSELPQFPPRTGLFFLAFALLAVAVVFLNADR